MAMRVLCFIFLGTLVFADEVYKENTEINSAAPCDKSLYGKEDLKQIIEFVANSLSIDKKLNDTIQSEAVPVVKKHVQRMQTTLNWFSNRPEHLKHVLEDVSVTRQHVEKSVDKIKRSLEKYSEFGPLYEEKSERAKAILKKFVHYAQLCELNCGEAQVEFRSAVTDSRSDRYCGSIAEIHRTTKDQLEKFVQETIQGIHQQVDTADKSYNDKVQERLNDLKRIALQEFGHTMYDILNLQDQYHHLKKNLKEFDNDYLLMVLRTLNIQLDALLMKFENLIGYFGNYCQKCNRVRHTREAILYTQNVDAVKNTNLLDSLIENKIAELNKNSDEELHTIFKELDENLNNPIMDKFFTEHLKPIKMDVADLTRKEIEAFQELNISKLNVDMDLVKKLIANTKELLNAIAKEYQAIIAIIKDLVPK